MLDALGKATGLPVHGWSVDTSLKVAAGLTGVLEYLEDPTTDTPRLGVVLDRDDETGMRLANPDCTPHTSPRW
ncbi:hypothetical protein G5C51_22865 [Streptomyces sp. A7024]|uniref:Uncharacterized protein n=1 Tax=Streptomyces coryli TaxID=1128680 RepID=A0A6G4U3R9_9ACTN|nr:hypothetical protein [Streptomyces coryli]NGN66733.1 hypothetical protein [Streptomyces coryli]